MQSWRVDRKHTLRHFCNSEEDLNYPAWVPRSLPDISIRQLEYLVAVADAADVGAAADVGRASARRRCRRGWPSSNAGSASTLFEPDGRRRVLRPAAQPVLDHARQVVSLTGDLVGLVGSGAHGADAVGSGSA